MQIALLYKCVVENEFEKKKEEEEVLNLMDAKQRLKLLVLSNSIDSLPTLWFSKVFELI